MLVPRLPVIVRAIAQTIDEILAPVTQTQRERSAVVTIRHMLRYVEIAVEKEGEQYFDEANQLRALLADISGRHMTLPPFDAIVASMADAISTPRDPTIYPSVPILTAEINAMTQLVDDMLVAIHASLDHQRDSKIMAVHQAIRDHISWQIKNEAKTIEPAFVGFGARR